MPHLERRNRASALRVAGNRWIAGRGRCEREADESYVSGMRVSNVPYIFDLFP